jgi:hypothetical protein
MIKKDRNEPLKDRLEHIAGYSGSDNNKKGFIVPRRTVKSAKKFSPNQLIETKNRFHILGDNKTDLNSGEPNLQLKILKTDPQKKNTRRSISILGDSIIKFIDGNRLNTENERVYAKSFRGAKTGCMYSYAIPSLKENPELVILHCGTNDLKKEQDPERVAQNIIALASHISKSNLNKPVFVSSLTCRYDEIKLSKKVYIVNSILKVLCQESNFGYVDNSNIKKEHLNLSNLHLNQSGTSILEKIFKNVISN